MSVPARQRLCIESFVGPSGPEERDEQLNLGDRDRPCRALRGHTAGAGVAGLLDPKGVVMSISFDDRLRALAREIVVNHEYPCVGTFRADKPFCSCAPEGHPLCKPCELLAESIEAFGRAVAALARKCDCGRMMTMCSGCAFEDYQAAHPDCPDCCLAPLSPQKETE